MRNSSCGEGRRWETKEWLVLAIVLWAGCVILGCVVGWGGGRTGPYGSLISEGPGMLAASWLWYKSSLREGRSERQRRVTRLFAAAFLVSGLGPLVWLCYMFVLPEWLGFQALNPGWIGFYILMFAGLITIRRHWGMGVWRASFVLDMSLALAAGFLLKWYLVLAPSVSRGITGSSLHLLIYPVADLMLLAGVSATWLTLAQPLVSALSLLQVGLLCFMFGDSGWMRALAHGATAVPAFPTACWAVGGAFAALSGYLSLISPGTSFSDAAPSPASWRELAVTATAFVVTETVQRVFERTGGPVLRYGSVVIFGLIVARLAVALVWNQRLYRQLGRSEARFRSLVQSSSDAILIMDAQGQVGYESPSVGDLIGRDPARHISVECLFERVHPAELNSVRQVWHQTLSTPGRSRRIAFRLLGADGDWHHIITRVRNLTNESDVGGIVWNLRDVTEQMVAQERWERMVQLSPTLIYSTEPEYPNKITFVSQNISELLGYSAAETLEIPDRFWSCIHPDDLEAAKEAPRRLASGRPYFFDLRMRHADGTYRWLRSSSNFIRDAGGRPVEIVGNMVDMTEFRQLTDALRAANAELEERVTARTRALEQELEERLRAEEALRQSEQERAKVQDRFLQIAAHELRNPMAGVTSMLSLLRFTIDTGQPLTKLNVMADAMEKEVARLSSLLNEILDAFRSRDSRLSLHMAPVDLADVIAEAVRPSLAMRPGQIRFLREMEASYRIQGDARRLEEVFRNLLGNSLKYSPPSTDITVRIYHSPDGRDLIATVTDRGIGIPADQVQNVFEGFVRGKNLKGQDPGGMGLGLFICREIIQQHGGRIWANSREGVGSTIYVALPTGRERRGQEDGTHSDCGG